jgi:2-polyprenyl-3-methyl-5-hydroxy-6-metoxy-1,4-benzoquinol methylase
MIQQRLHNQRLVGISFTQPDEVVLWLGAVQAQEYPGTSWGLLSSSAASRTGRYGGIMSADQQRTFPGWEEMYQHQTIESMPWFYPELDDDLRQALEDLGLRDGRMLDLGTGPGTQAMQLARKGFDVTAIDISEAAIRLAQEKAEAQGLAIAWVQDDILATGLTRQFELIFDRGCFHVLPPERRQDYVSTVAGLLKPNGYLFLKCFSYLQPGTQGPHRFTPDQIRQIFGRQFHVRSLKETVYQGTLEPLPRALFCTMWREE